MLLDVTPETLLQVFGRFHIVLLHLPIGLIPAMLVLEFGAAALKRPLPKGALQTLAVMTALTAAAAFGSGLVLADEKVDSDLLGLHKKFAIAMASCSLLLPLLALRSSRRPFRVGLVACMALAVATGHYGGSLTHKKDFLFKPFARQAALQDERAEQLTTTQGTQSSEAVDERSRYSREVAPVFERCCNSCHNPEDLEGDLDLSTRAAVLEGWGDGDVIVVAGKPDESILIESLGLPLDDEMHMPPADEDQLTPDEIRTIRAWITDGCPE